MMISIGCVRSGCYRKTPWEQTQLPHLPTVREDGWAFSAFSWRRRQCDAIPNIFSQPKKKKEKSKFFFCPFSGTWRHIAASSFTPPLLETFWNKRVVYGVANKSRDDDRVSRCQGSENFAPSLLQMLLNFPVSSLMCSTTKATKSVNSTISGFQSNEVSILHLILTRCNWKIVSK